jgi:hypothetical protein
MRRFDLATDRQRPLVIRCGLLGAVVSCVLCTN